MTVSSRPSPAAAVPTLIAMRTAAPCALSTHGWSGTANASVSGSLAFRCCSITRRLKVWRRLLVVMKPKRSTRPVRTCCAAWCHQYMTKSALSGTSGHVARSVCV